LNFAQKRSAEAAAVAQEEREKTKNARFLCVLLLLCESRLSGKEWRKLSFLFTTFVENGNSL
jgi:hypothetical protein